ncbi:MAG: MBL fold metallo-hydrolase [Acidimicrobiales bacterium]|jgi:L-ascorbate metabolism protein UlaG (beta-lactamase superfamily)|nr:MBL fold metallo-hydrolase [Acidimicrobiales bacterium]
MTTTLDWYGCATFRMRTAGLTVFLDACIDRAEIADGPGLTADEIDECDWIVIGHSHFDHLYGAERVAANTGATIIGSYETVRVMEQAGVPLDQMICVANGSISATTCSSTFTRASTAASGRTARWISPARSASANSA